MSKRVRYQKGSLEEAVRAARALSASHNLYIFGTYFGYQIAKDAPPFHQSYILVHPIKARVE